MVGEVAAVRLEPLVVDVVEGDRVLEEQVRDLGPAEWRGLGKRSRLSVWRNGTDTPHSYLKPN